MTQSKSKQNTIVLNSEFHHTLQSKIKLYQLSEIPMAMRGKLGL